MRKIIRKNRTSFIDSHPHGIFGVFEIDETKGGQTPRNFTFADRVDLPYGTPVMLLSIEKLPQTWTGKKNMCRVRLLYGETYIVGQMSHMQLNKWFCRADVWKKHYAGKSPESLQK